MKSLIDLNKDYLGLFSEIVAFGGEMSEEQSQKLDELVSAIASKVDTYKYVVDRLSSEADWHRDIAKSHQTAAKACDSAIDRLRTALLHVADSQGANEINGESVRALIVSGKESVNVLDEGSVPAIYLREKITYEIDKAKIIEAVNAGQPVPKGVEIKKSRSIRFYASKPRLETK